MCSPFDTFASTFNLTKWRSGDQRVTHFQCSPFPPNLARQTRTHKQCQRFFASFCVVFQSATSSIPLCTHQSVSFVAIKRYEYHLCSSVHSGGSQKRRRRMIAFRSPASPFHNFFFSSSWLRLVLRRRRRVQGKNKNENRMTKWIRSDGFFDTHKHYSHVTCVECSDHFAQFLFRDTPSERRAIPLLSNTKRRERTW